MREQTVAGRFWTTVQSRAEQARVASLWDDADGEHLAPSRIGDYDGDDGASPYGPY